MPGPEFLSGVIEGFYGRPWSFEQRTGLLPRLRDLGFNTYVYAPKDDIKLRTRWREQYDGVEADRLSALVRACQEAGVRFVYAISPGLDVRYGEPADLAWLVGKVDRVLSFGVHDVALLFDDISHSLHPEDDARFGGLAAAQAHLAEWLFQHLRQVRPDGLRLVCPTIYCRRDADTRSDGWRYLHDLGQRLGDDVDVFWTGEDVVSEHLDAAAMADVRDALGRRPVLWDNLHADDYDVRSVYLGPYTGRAADLPSATRGIVTNPNGALVLNEVPFATLAAYLRDPEGYHPDSALRDALGRWRSSLDADDGSVITSDELWLLIDLFHLPWRCGPNVEARLEDAAALLEAPPDPDDPRLSRLEGFAKDVARLCQRLTELRDRELFYALHGVALEARRESRVLVDYLRHRAEHGASARYGRPDALPNTYRRGFAANVHELLPLDASGAIRPRGA